MKIHCKIQNNDSVTLILNNAQQYNLISLFTLKRYFESILAIFHPINRIFCSFCFINLSFAQWNEYKWKNNINHNTEHVYLSTLHCICLCQVRHRPITIHMRFRSSIQITRIQAIWRMYQPVAFTALLALSSFSHLLEQWTIFSHSDFVCKKKIDGLWSAIIFYGMWQHQPNSHYSMFYFHWYWKII